MCFMAPKAKAFHAHGLPMKVEPRVALLGLMMGVGLTITLVTLALASPGQGYLVLLFPAIFLWILIPFAALYIWRVLSERRERG